MSAAGLPVTVAVTALATPRVVWAQTPRITPPPPCRAAPSDTAVATAGHTSRRGVTSVAVLEFDSRVMDEQKVYLAPALTVQLRNRIATIPAVVVESRGTVERVFASSAGRIDSLLSALGDQYAVTGAVVPQRDGIDVTVRVIQSGKEGAKWERVFSYPRTSVFQIEESVGQAVAELAESRLPKIGRPVSEAAYELVLRGDYFLAQHDPVSADSARRAYERAMEADRSSAVPPARIARARAELLERLGRYDSRVTGEQTLAGLAMADAALRRDSANADAWTARAMLLRYRNPTSYDGAIGAHTKAIERVPNSADAHEAYGMTLMQLGRDAAAEQQLRRALALEPNRASTLRALGELEHARRHYAGACSYANASIGADPYDPLSYALRARVRIQLNEFRDALSDAEIAMRLSAAPWGDALQLLVTAAGTTVDDARLEARRVAASRLRPGVRMSVPEGMYTSLAFEALGDRDRAIEALRRIDPNGVELAMVLRDPAFDPMRGDARFRRIATDATKPRAAEAESSGSSGAKRLDGSARR